MKRKLDDHRTAHGTAPRGARSVGAARWRLDFLFLLRDAGTSVPFLPLGSSRRRAAGCERSPSREAQHAGFLSISCTSLRVWKVLFCYLLVRNENRVYD